MERKIGERFEFNGVLLEVKECLPFKCSTKQKEECYYKSLPNMVSCPFKERGYCGMSLRTDGKSVCFVEVKKEKAK